MRLLEKNPDRLAYTMTCRSTSGRHGVGQHPRTDPGGECGYSSGISKGKLYWGDREGMRVMRANLDGSEIETLIERGRTDADRRDETNWCVGISVDSERGVDCSSFTRV